jgi:ATP-dependent Clp protease ATP-binding subunit ClpA
MFEHFDERARLCIVYAQEELGRLGHDELGTVHLLLGIARIDEELIGVDVERVRAAVVAVQGIGAPARDPAPVGADAKAAFERANAQALAVGHTTIDPAHLLLALLEIGGGGARALRESGATPGDVRERAKAAAGQPRPTMSQAPFGPGNHVHALRSGHPVAVRLGGDGLPLGDLGHPSLDAALLELLLVNDSVAARLLRAHGIDEQVLRETFPPFDQPG